MAIQVFRRHGAEIAAQRFTGGRCRAGLNTVKPVDGDAEGDAERVAR